MQVDIRESKTGPKILADYDAEEQVYTTICKLCKEDAAKLDKIIKLLEGSRRTQRLFWA